MQGEDMKKVVSCSVVEDRIFLLRGHRVMLSPDLARLYEVEQKTLIQAVKRNTERFPDDFMFQLSWDEALTSRSQIVTLNQPIELSVVTKKGANIKYRPYAFTEQGVAMLSSVLRSRRAIQVNIVIMRAFVKLKEILLTHKELAHKLDELERKVQMHDSEIQSVFEAIRRLMEPPPEKPKPRIGFHT